MPWTIIEAPEGTEFYSDNLAGVKNAAGEEYLGGWYWEDGARWYHVKDETGEFVTIGDPPSTDLLKEIRDIELEGSIPVYKKDGQTFRSIDGKLTPCYPDGSLIPAPVLFTPDVPDHPWIFNRRRSDGTYPDIKDFFNRPIGGNNG